MAGRKKANSIIDSAIEKNPDLFKLRKDNIYANYRLKLGAEFIKDSERAFRRQTELKIGRKEEAIATATKALEAKDAVK